MATCPKRPRIDTAAKECSGDLIPTLCLMGATGVGKGSTLNSCFRSSDYSVGHMFASDTTKPVSRVLPWRGTGGLVRGVDLCGFSDSEGRDSGFIESMVAYLKNDVKYVHCFLLLFNSQETRIGMHLKDMLVSIKTVFGLSFMNHVMIGFTRWEYTKRASILRRGISKDALTANVNRLLRDILGHEHECPCVFIDNTLNLCTDAELQELFGDELPSVTGAFEQAIDTIYNSCMRNGAFQCADIESTLAARDVGRDMIEREEAAHAEVRRSLEALLTAWASRDVEEPADFAEALRASAQRERSRLAHFLASTTRPDLEHVGEAVLNTFDTQVAADVKTYCWKNSQAAASFNRSLRLELVASYVKFIEQQIVLFADESSKCFDEVIKQDRELIVQYVSNSKGGSLSWAGFAVLQEQLRWEQLVAIEKLFGTGCGNAKPIRAFLKDAGSLVSFLGGEHVPKWLSQLAVSSAT